MGHWKLWIAIFTALDTIWCLSSASSYPKLGLIRSPTTADTTNKCLSRVKDASILSWPTIISH
eukprot:scaffold26568_cov98-Skeletonema_marinoi.AAC.1